MNIKILSEEQFSQMEVDWQNLLKQSNADPLFLSWSWQYIWWKTWGDKLNLELFLLAAYDNDELIGLAPLFINCFNLGPLRNFKRLQFIGNAWRLSDTVRTEYLSFIIRKDKEHECQELLFDYLNNANNWDEWLVNDIDLSSRIFSDYLQLAEQRLIHLRHISQDLGYKIDSSQPFSQYLAELGKNTRFKAFNSREKVSAHGELKIENVSSNDQIVQAFENLNNLHSQRWGSKCFKKDALNFHLQLSQKMLDENALQMSHIYYNNQVVSTLYNLQIENKEYNIQAGFTENFMSRISLGSLHLGFSIARVFKYQKTETLDLLAGKGMNSDYKKKYKGERIHFKTVQFIRNPLLRILYYCYEHSPIWLKEHLYGRKGFG